MNSSNGEVTVHRWTRPIATTAATVAAAGLVVLGGAGVAFAADPTPGYPGGGYPGGYTGGGGPGGGIDTTNPKPGGPVTVTATCTTGSSATLTFDGSTIATAPVSNGTAVLTGNVPADASGSHTVVATCDGGASYSFAVTVGGSGSSSGGALASTGAKVATATGGGLVLVASGVGLMVVSRRRHGSTA